VLWQGPRVCTIAAPASLLYHLFKQYFGVGYHCGFNHSPCSFCSYPDEFESTRIIGERQFKKAVELFNKATEQLKGKVGYRHAYLNFSNLEVAQGNDVVKTCPAAMGFAFAAGTTDGPGAFDFKQGDDEVTYGCNIYVLNYCILS
jgi:neutral ceramidase